MELIQRKYHVKNARGTMVGSYAKNSTVVISGFPGIGKSWCAEAFGNDFIDRDSSQYKWSEKGVVHPEWPRNYINSISGDIIEGFRYVCVSSHAEVRQYLAEYGIPYTIAVPGLGDKERYLERYLTRGSDDAFIDLLSENWEKWITECHHDIKAERIIVVGAGRFLIDYLMEENYAKCDK